jgi:hypothetical protein
MKDVIAMVDESANSLATWQKVKLIAAWVDGVLKPRGFVMLGIFLAVTYLCYPPDVLVAVFLCEAQVFVQSEAYVVAVQTVCAVAKVEEMLLERRCDGGLSGRREAGEPDGEALLLAEAIALSARQRWVPGDVAAYNVSDEAIWWGNGGAHVAIVEVWKLQEVC